MRGIAPVGTDTVSVNRDAIAQSGKMSTDDILATIPQVSQFNTIPAGTAGQGSPTVRPSLRGLSGSGNNPTLILFNGHRAIGAGILQTVPDPAVLPPGVIDRVDVMPDGGSSIYGSDAVAGVINFVTRKRFNGAEASAHYGSGDGYHTWDANLTAGKDWGSGSAYLSYAENQHSAIFGNQRDFVTGDSRPRGGSSFLSTTCAPGSVTVAGTTYPLPGLATGAANTCDPTDQATYYPSEKRKSLYGHVFQRLSDTLNFEGEAYASKQESTVNSASTLRNASGTITPANPYYKQIPGTPAGAPQSVTTSLGIAAPSYNVFDAYGVTGTLTWDINDNWQLRTMVNLGRSNSTTLDYSQGGGANPTALAAAYAGTTLATAFNPYDPQSTDRAVLNQISEWSQYANAVQKLGQVRTIADGDLVDLPGGALRLAVGAEYYFEGYHPQSSATGITGAQQIFTANGTRHTQSVFGELFIPVVGKANQMTGVRAFDISLSARTDDISGSAGRVTNPKIGFNYKPVNELTLRGSWGKSFIAPSLADTNAVDTRAQLIGRVVSIAPGSPPPPNSSGTILFAGGNPNLRPEKAKTWSLGADWRVSAVPGLNASLTYWNIDYKDRITQLFGQLNSGQIYSNPGLASYYTVNPSLAQLKSTFQGVRLDGFTLEQLYAGGKSPYVYLDARRFNLATVNLEGVDFDLAYKKRTSFGSVDARLGGTYKLTSRSTPAQGAATVNDLNNGTGKLMYVATVGGTAGAYSARLTYNYLGGYPIVQVNNRRIGSFEVMNFYLGYDLGKAGLVSGATLSLNIDNLADRKPPYSNTSTGTANGSTVGRLFTLGFDKKF
ncbi:hypothetical protein IA69_15465 [Massilia sp. JS1662]|nr:hypothetical protein IA69_15465 [Massilia sp. JS1662]